MYNLYCEPLGQSDLQMWIQQAEQSSHGGSPGVLLILPNSFLISAVRQQANIKCLSFDELVAEICALGGCQARLISRATQELLLEKVLAELTAAGKIPYFEQVALLPGYISAITSLIGEIKRAGVLPDEFASVAEAADSQIKHQELLTIYQAYQADLTAYRLADLEEMIFIAERILAVSPDIISYKHIMMCEFYVMTPLQLAMLRRLKQCVEKFEVTSVFEKNRDRIFGAVEYTYAELVGMGFKPHFNSDNDIPQSELAFLRQKLFSVSDVYPRTSECLFIHKCADRNQEIAVVARIVKELLVNGKYKPNDIVLTARDPGRYARLRAAFIDYGIPIDLPKVMMLSELPVSRLALRFLMVARDGFNRRGLFNILKSTFVEQAFMLDGAALENCFKDYPLLTWEDLWSVTAELVRQQILSVAEQEALQKINRLISTIPREGMITEHVVALSAVLSALKIPKYSGQAYKTGNISLDLLKRQMVSLSMLEEKAQQAVSEFELVGQVRKVIVISEFIEYFTQVIGGQEVVLEKRDSGGVKLISPAEARGMKFSVVIAMGMMDGEFPGAATENWLYSDGERSLLNDLGVEMATTVRLRQLEDLYFALTAAMAGEQLIFTYYEDDKSLMSPYIEEIKELFDFKVVEKIHTANEIFPADYKQVFSEGDLRQKTIFDAFNLVEDISPAAASVFCQVLPQQGDSGFWRKVDAGRSRDKGQSDYSGLVGPLPKKPKVYSITDLEEYSKCPFKYYISRILHIAEWSEKEEDVRSDAIGQIYHETLAAFLRSYRGQTLLADRLSDYLMKLDAVFAQVEIRLINDRIVYPGIWWQFERERIRKVLHMWLEQEIADQQQDNFRPCYLEWGFGLPVRPGMDEHSTNVPLTLPDDSDEIYLCGKIDRIDKLDEQMIVLDYKRKTVPSYKDIEKGLSLQIPVYIMAVEQLLHYNRQLNASDSCKPDDLRSNVCSGQVVGGGYYRLEPPARTNGIWQLAVFPVKKKNYLQQEEWQQCLAGTQKIITDYIAAIRNGQFPVRPAAGACKFCYAHNICRFDRTLAVEEEEQHD